MGRQTCASRSRNLDDCRLTDWLKHQVRDLEVAFPGVSSYSTIRNLVRLWGYEAAKLQLMLWAKAGTSAPRKGAKR